MENLQLRSVVAIYDKFFVIIGGVDTIVLGGENKIVILLNENGQVVTSGFSSEIKTTEDKTTVDKMMSILELHKIEAQHELPKIIMQEIDKSIKFEKSTSISV